MDSLSLAPSSLPSGLTVLPDWSRSRNRKIMAADAAFYAGIALKSLDDLVRLEAPWSGCWCARQALKCAVSAARLSGRKEDEAGLRDAVLLTAPGDDLGRYCQVVFEQRFDYWNGMKLPSSFPRLKGFRFLREVIAYAVWAYHQFAMSTVDMEDLLAERGIIVSRETVRLWGNRFSRHFADCIRRDRPKPNDKWHMDEVVITICGKTFWLWRAIDADGDVLDILVQPRRNEKATKRFFSQLVKQYGEPRVAGTDKLKSDIKPIQNLAPDADHRAHKGLNNRIENSHRQTRKREKIMGQFKSPHQAQRFLFLSTHDQINTIFRPRRYKLSATSHRHARTDAFSPWADYTAEMVA